MRILVTGITGFVGGHLVRVLRERIPGAEIFGLARGEHRPERRGEACLARTRPGSEFSREGSSVLPIENLLCLDLRKAEAVREACQKVAPNWVVHLAAQSFVPGAFTSPRETWEINWGGTFHLLEALRESGFTGRFLFVGSGEFYGKVKEEDLPIRETQPFRPRNPYAASKAAAELLCYQYSQSYGFDVVLARPFNHIGPGQSPRFVVSDFCRQVARIELGRQEPVLYVGNLAVSRDFLDVRDVVAAYLCLLEHGQGSEAYNICSGQEIRLAELVRAIVGFSSRSIEIRADRTRIRPTDTPRFSGSHEKLTKHTGWQPKRDILTTVREVFTYWKEEQEG